MRVCAAVAQLTTRVYRDVAARLPASLSKDSDASSLLAEIPSSQV